MSMHTLLTIAFALSMGAFWIGGPVVYSVFKRRGDTDTAGIILTILFIIAVAGGILTSTNMSRVDAKQIEANTRVAAADAQIQQILSGSWEVRENEGLRAREPYVALLLNGEHQPPTSIGCFSGKRVYDVLTEADFASVRTICFAVYAGEETAEYFDQSGSRIGKGTAEHRTCYLYDVESGTFFKCAPLNRKLPEKVSGSDVRVPHLTLDEDDYKTFIKEAM